MTDRPTPENWASILALGLIWGGTFMVTAVALEGHGPITVAAARTVLGAVSMLALMAVLGRAWPRDRAVWAYALPTGLMNTALPFFLLSWGIQHVPSAFAGLSMSAVPLFVLPLAHLFSDETMTGRATTGVAMGFCGALVLLGPGLVGLGTSLVATLGQLACVGAALSYAVASVLTRRCPPVDAITFSAVSLAVGGAVLVPLMLAFEGLPRLAVSRADGAIVFLGLVPTALATLIRTRVIQTAGSIFMTLVNYQVPVWAMVFGALVLSEALPLRFFAALALILTGLAISQWRGLKSVASR